MKQMFTTSNDVQFSNITITDLKKGTVEVTIKTKKPSGKRWLKKRVVTCTISPDLREWLFQYGTAIAKDHLGNIYSDPDNKMTGFQKYLVRKNIPFKRGILKELVFESNNLSEDYYENPFKVIQYDDGHNSLTLVNQRPRKLINGKYVIPEKRFYAKASYRRWVLQSEMLIQG